MGNPSPKRRLFHGHWVTVGGWAGGGSSTRQAMGRVYRRPGAGQCKRRFCMQISIGRALTGVLQVSRWPRWSLEAWTCAVVHVQMTDRGMSIYKGRTALHSTTFSALRCAGRSVSRDELSLLASSLIARSNACSRISSRQYDEFPIHKCSY
jgi:hypothetical protein